jgi:hypothetical protein
LILPSSSSILSHWSASSLRISTRALNTIDSHARSWGTVDWFLSNNERWRSGVFNPSSPLFYPCTSYAF